jgi:hypothetical protein
VPTGPDPDRARAVLTRLDEVRATVAAAEDEVLACLVVTGEPGAQRVLDDWLDQVADTLRALGEVADDVAPAIARHAAAEQTSTTSAAPEGTVSPSAAPLRGGAGDPPRDVPAVER